MTSPKFSARSFDVTGLILVIVIFLSIALTLILTANGGRFPAPVPPSPSTSMFEARIHKLETQIFKN